MTTTAKDTFHLEHAYRLADASTCDRLSVGCILVASDGEIIGRGYNGAPFGMPDCGEAGHLMIDGHCKRAVHAEPRAVLYAALGCKRVAGATAYVTHAPCIDCANLLIEAGVGRVVYGADYRDGAGVERLRAAGVIVERDCAQYKERIDLF